MNNNNNNNWAQPVLFKKINIPVNIQENLNKINLSNQNYKVYLRECIINLFLLKRVLSKDERMLNKTGTSLRNSKTFGDLTISNYINNLCEIFQLERYTMPSLEQIPKINILISNIIKNYYYVLYYAFKNSSHRDSIKKMITEWLLELDNNIGKIIVYYIYTYLGNSIQDLKSKCSNPNLNYMIYQNSIKKQNDLEEFQRFIEQHVKYNSISGAIQFNILNKKLSNNAAKLQGNLNTANLETKPIAANLEAKPIAANLKANLNGAVKRQDNLNSVRRPSALSVNSNNNKIKAECSSKLAREGKPIKGPFGFGNSSNYAKCKAEKRAALLTPVAAAGGSRKKNTKSKK